MSAPSTTVRIPKKLAEALSPSGEQLNARVAEAIAVALFRRGEVSSRWAAAELGMPWEAFLEVLHRFNVPYIDLTPEELEQDIANAERFATDRLE
jgi:predicted HTH domain antitoxin